MKHGTICRAQLGRLFHIVLKLQIGGHPRAADLAHSCGVSRRTIYRDLETLAHAGLPVRYHPDRLGYAIDPSFWLAPPQLSQEETRALVAVVCARDRETPEAVHQLAQAAIQKVIAALAPPARREGQSLLANLCDRRAHRPTRSTTGVFVALLAALGRRRQVRIVYREPQCNPNTAEELQQTRLNPYHLVRHGAGWSLVGRSSAHKARRVIQLEHIHRVDELDEPINPPDRSHREPATTMPLLDRS